MFSVAQKRGIAADVQRILRSTGHPELPPGEIQFFLHVDGNADWSWADIQNNGAIENPIPNPHNEAQEKKSNSFLEALLKDVTVHRMVQNGNNLYDIVVQLVAEKEHLAKELAKKLEPTTIVFSKS